MTTIAYVAGVMASDSRISTEGGLICTDKARKIWKLSNGALLGLSNSIEPMEMLLRAAEEAADDKQVVHDMEFSPDLLGEGTEVNGILVEPNGTIYLTEGRVWREWPENFAAIGSGAHFIFSLLKKGFSAVDAVETAKTLDCYSGGDVVTVTLDGK